MHFTGEGRLSNLVYKRGESYRIRCGTLSRGGGKEEIVETGVLTRALGEE